MASDAVLAMQARRKARGMSDPLNRLRAYCESHAHEAIAGIEAAPSGDGARGPALAGDLPTVLPEYGAEAGGSPEMLAVLREIAALEPKTKIDSIGMLKRARHLAKIAIAKAEGSK